MSFGDALLGNLRSVMNEGSIINANLVGSNQTGYKGSTHSYGGGGATQSNGLQIPDQNLTTSHTSINFEQGQITQSDQQTHMAISGQGFFVVQAPQDVGVNQPNVVTRAGEFRFTDIAGLGQVLTTHNGLVVMNDPTGTGAGPFNAITKADFDSGVLPSVLTPVNDLGSLEFSQYGGSSFEFEGGLQAADGIIKLGSLESANVGAQDSLAAMSLYTKKFSSMAAQIKNENTLLDIVTNLI